VGIDALQERFQNGASEAVRKKCIVKKQKKPEGEGRRDKKKRNSEKLDKVSPKWKVKLEP